MNVLLFKNTTKYTKENCNFFLEFHRKKYGTKELIKLILIGILIFYILVLNIIYHNWLLLLGIVLCGMIIFFIQKYIYQKQHQEKKKIKIFTFFFYDNYMKIKYKKNFERYAYFKLHKIFETEKYFYLYTDETSSFILKKDGFTVGTPEDFAQFIKSKCPFKYSKQ